MAKSKNFNFIDFLRLPHLLLKRSLYLSNCPEGLIQPIEEIIFIFSVQGKKDFSLPEREFEDYTMFGDKSF